MSVPTVPDSPMPCENGDTSKVLSIDPPARGSNALPLSFRYMSLPDAELDYMDVYERQREMGIYD